MRSCTILFSASLSLLLGSCHLVPSADQPVIERGEARSLFPGDPPLSIRWIQQIGIEEILQTTQDEGLVLESTAEEPELGEKARMTRPDPGRVRIELVGVEDVFAEQESGVWCWAACAQMILRYSGSVPSGVPLEQEEIAQYFHGEEKRAADLSVITRVLAPELELVNARVGVDLGGDLRVMGGDDLVRAVASGELAVAGFRGSGRMGHVCLITGIEYAEIRRSEQEERTEAMFMETALDRLGLKGEAREVLAELIERASGRYAIHEVRLFDPFPGEGQRSISGEEFRKTCDFFLTQSMAREILQTDFSSLTGVQQVENEFDRQFERLESVVLPIHGGRGEAGD